MNGERYAQVVGYVVGFLFAEDREDPWVVLIEKARPEWQKGKLNGVGGKIEPGETPDEAMRREFREETGLDVQGWRRFADLIGSQDHIVFFEARAPWVELTRVQNQDLTEPVRVLQVSGMAFWPAVPNLRWLIPLALDPEMRATSIFHEPAAVA